MKEYLLCDFCVLSVKRDQAHAYRQSDPKATINVCGLPVGFGDPRWCACEECNALLEVKDWAGIARRTYSFAGPAIDDANYFAELVRFYALMVPDREGGAA